LLRQNKRQLLVRSYIDLNLGNRAHLLLLQHDEQLETQLLEPMIPHTTHIDVQLDVTRLDEKEQEHVLANFVKLVRGLNKLEGLYLTMPGYDSVVDSDDLPAITRFWSKIIDQVITHARPELEELQIEDAVELSSCDNARFSPLPELGDRWSKLKTVTVHDFKHTGY